MLNVEQIIAETKEVFFKTNTQRSKFQNITDFISESAYFNLHRNFLTPLKLKIDIETFSSEIVQYLDYFEQWGTRHTHLPRLGLALVNQDGKLKRNDPINGSLYEWNEKHPLDPLLEIDCKNPTEVMNLNSLKPLEILNGHWCRSNILKWSQGAEFKPHIDTLIPSAWFRLWGVDRPKNINLKFWNPQKQEMEIVENIEPGRLYLIDTSIVHDAYAINDVYQFFLSTLPSSVNMMEDLICH